MGQPSPVAQDSPTGQDSPTEQDHAAAGHAEPAARSPYAEHTARLTRSLAHALVSENDDAELAETVRALATRLLDASEAPAAVTVDDPHPRSGFRRDITPITSAVNPLAPPMAIRREGDESVSDVALPLQYQGPPARVHGGIVALMLDQVLGNAAHSTGLPGAYTRELTITYDAATPLDRPVQVVGRIDRVEGRKRFMSGEVLVDGAPSARAHGLWISPR
ncbi:PaaI family thioesterase [Brevibacterium jeotgali]|uniref:Acyl-coenzyme A thioesterase THEM4 n=1 Tax=Brevibacterium jeotgali TaxID=1262550 RepID=A0A2H1L3Y9_9MICO|nr:PaaI family thioesterase [Brevibacterium jeotgali]TWB98786.1 thioesterase superfamily protein [Brevibacterium jeotgali]SMY11614.1 Thioesterase superfamily protein [Brevibacterium jeotgali]